MYFYYIIRDVKSISRSLFLGSTLYELKLLEDVSSRATNTKFVCERKYNFFFFAEFKGRCEIVADSYERVFLGSMGCDSPMSILHS